MMGYMGGWDDKKKASVFALHCMVNGMVSGMVWHGFCRYTHSERGRPFLRLALHCVEMDYALVFLLQSIFFLRDCL